MVIKIAANTQKIIHCQVVVFNGDALFQEIQLNQIFNFSTLKYVDTEINANIIWLCGYELFNINLIFRALPYF